MRQADRAAAALGLLVALAAGPSASAAEAAPFVTPQHDVDVTYVIAGADPLMPRLTQRMRWSAALWRQRLDPPGAASMITDYRAQTLLVIDPERRQALLLPAPANDVRPAGQRAHGSYARIGEQLVAGTRCTEWRMPDASGASSLVCFTADGVMLRASQGDRVLLEAVRVSYAPQDAALFSAPPGLVVRPPEPR